MELSHENHCNNCTFNRYPYILREDGTVIDSYGGQELSRGERIISCAYRIEQDLPSGMICHHYKPGYFPFTVSAGEGCFDLTLSHDGGGIHFRRLWWVYALDPWENAVSPTQYKHSDRYVYDAIQDMVHIPEKSSYPTLHGFLDTRPEIREMKGVTEKLTELYPAFGHAKMVIEKRQVKHLGL